MALIDGYQIFQKLDDGTERPVSLLYGAFFEAAAEKRRLRKMGGLYEIKPIINQNNTK